MKNIFGLSVKKYLLSDDNTISVTAVCTILFILSKAVLGINGLELNVIKVSPMIMDIANILQYLFGAGGIIGFAAKFNKAGK